MKILIACEYSAIVRDAFRAKGHDAWSCDLLETEGDSRWHLQWDVLEILNDGWDMMIAHPDCTFLTNAASKHLYTGKKKETGVCEERWQNMEDAASFYNLLKTAPIEKRCIENPIMHCHARELVDGKATQYVQPWWFGSKKNKATGLRLFNLPPLVKTNVVGPMPKHIKKGTPEYRSWNECWYMSPGPDRSKQRARTDTAIAKAMAEQWG